MDSNPYAPPQSDIESSGPSPSGPSMPFENRNVYPGFWNRLFETLRWVLTDRERSGLAIGGSQEMLSPILFCGLWMLLPVVTIGLLQAFHPMHPFWFSWLGMPKPTAPVGLAQTIAILGGLGGGLIGGALGLAINGLLNHGGLWMVRGTRQALGLVATYRCLFYTQGTIAAVLFPLQLLQYLPGRLGMGVQMLVVCAQVSAGLYHGVLLAKTHQTQLWRGIAGVWLPWLILGGCCAACFGVLWFVGGEAFQNALLQGLRGGH